jgi:hypothetical protein
MQGPAPCAIVGARVYSHAPNPTPCAMRIQLARDAPASSAGPGRSLRSTAAFARSSPFRCVRYEQDSDSSGPRVDILQEPAATPSLRGPGDTREVPERLALIYTRSILIRSAAEIAGVSAPTRAEQDLNVGKVAIVTERVDYIVAL